MALVAPPGSMGFGQMPPWSGTMQSFGGSQVLPPPSGSMSAYPTMPLTGTPFGGPGMSPTPPMPPPMGTMPMTSFPAQGGPAPGSFAGPPGSMSFNSMGSMPPPGSMPPGSMPGTMPPGNMPPGTMPPGSMPANMLGSRIPPGTMPPRGNMPPGTMPRGMPPPSNMPPRGMPQSQGLHHGFGHSDSFASPQMSKHTHAMMKVTDHNTVGNDLGVERPMNMWIKFGEFSPIYPTPETPQYGYWGKDALEREFKIQEEFCSKLEDFGCFGRANLRGVCDTATMSFAERMVTPWQWTFIHADGWNINFWPEDFHTFKDTGKDDGSVCPIASLDIRQILAANYQREASSSEGALAPFEVHVNFQTGYFPFRVVDELEAQEWCVRIMKGVVETVKVQQVREKYMQHHSKMDELEVEAHRIERDPVRCQKLADLWHQAVESVERGARPTRQIFFELYALYDCLDLPPEYDGCAAEEEERRGDGNLTMYEIEVLCREFLDMKYHEVQAIVVRQEKELFHQHRPVAASREHSLRWTIDQGRELMDHYQNQRNPKDFFDRVVNFHHRCDISREGRVDPQEFLNAAPVFLMPNMELRKEGLFFASAEESSPDAHRERRQEHGAPEPEEEESGGCTQS